MWNSTFCKNSFTPWYNDIPNRVDAMVPNITVTKEELLQKSAIPHHHALFTSQGNLRMSIHIIKQIVV